MILKTAANYNDEGGYIEAWKNSDGTTEVKLIPKSGGDEDKQGLQSLSISPAVTTTPPLEEVLPVFYQDSPKTYAIAANWETSSTYTVIATPTSGWSVYTDDKTGEVGQPFEFTLSTDEGGTITAGTNFGVQSPDATDDSRYLEFVFRRAQ